MAWLAGQRIDVRDDAGGQRHQPRGEGGQRMKQQEHGQALGTACLTVFQAHAVAMAFEVAERFFDLHAFGIVGHDLSGVAFDHERGTQRVARVSEVTKIRPDQLKPLPQGHTFNRAVAALVDRRSGPVALLSGRRLLLEEEQERLSRWSALAEERLG